MDDSPDAGRGDAASRPAPDVLGFDFLESSPFAQIAFTFDLEILAANENHCAMTGKRREAMIGRPLFEVFPANPDAPDANAEAPLRRSVERVRATGAPDQMPVVKHDVESLDAPGGYEERYWQLIHSPLRGADGAVAGILQTARNVTEEVGLRRVEDARRRSAESGGKLQFLSVDLSTGAMVPSRGLDALFGFDPDEPRTLERLVAHIHEEDRPAILADLERARSRPTGSSFDTEYRVVRPDGSVRHVNALVEVVAQGAARRLAGMLIDTTAIHRREASLRRLLEEKQALLADVNHRVKNTLQLIASLLRIEERAAVEPVVADRLAITAGRVAAITAIHASLYHYADVARVDVSDHLRVFCAQLSEEFGRRIRLDLGDEPVHLSAERAVPLALIVNELASRALRRTQEGSITVSLRERERYVLLRIENAVKSASAKPGPIGSRLLEGLVVQLGATWKQDPAHGDCACIEFEQG